MSAPGQTMRHFWVGVLTGVAATILVGALLVLFATQRARADGLNGNVIQPFFIRALIEHHGEYGTIEQIDEQSITIVQHDGNGGSNHPTVERNLYGPVIAQFATRCFQRGSHPCS